MKQLLTCWSFITLLLFIHSVVSNSLQPRGLQHVRLPWPSPSPRACANSCPLSQWCHPTIQSSVLLFSSCFQSFPAAGSFLMSRLFTSGGQSIGVSASASVLPMNIQDWFNLGLTSLQSKGLSRVFSNTTIRKHQFSGGQPSLCPTLTSIHDYSKNHSLDYTDLCRQSNVSAFIFFEFFKIYFIFFPIIFISWRLITLQYCSGFCHTVTWISHGFTCVPHPEHPSNLPPHPIHLGHPSVPAPSTCLMHPTWTGDLFHTW